MYFLSVIADGILANKSSMLIKKILTGVMSIAQWESIRLERPRTWVQSPAPQSKQKSCYSAIKQLKKNKTF